jgi:acyl carrier protein
MSIGEVMPGTAEEFVRNFENAIEGIEPGSLTPDTEFATIEQWDSLAALSVLAMVDAEYDTEISGNELRKCRTLQDLFGVIQSKKQ